MFADQTVANNSCTAPAVPAGLKLPDHPSSWGGDGAHQAASEATNAIAWQRGGQHHKPPPSSLPRLHGLRRGRRCCLLHGLHRLCRLKRSGHSSLRTSGVFKEQDPGQGDGHQGEQEGQAQRHVA